MLVLLGLAALGVFSKGPLSRVTASSPSGAIAVDHERFLRLGAASTIFINVSGAKRETEVIVNPDFVDALTLENVYPVPRRSSARPDGTHLLFDTPSGKGRIVMSVRPDAVGFADAKMSVAEVGGSAAIPFFVFP